MHAHVQIPLRAFVRLGMIRAVNNHERRRRRRSSPVVPGRTNTSVWPSMGLLVTLMGFAIIAALVAQPGLAAAAGAAGLALAGRLARHLLPERTQTQRQSSRNRA